MSSLLTSAQITNLTGAFYKQWETFSQFNTITVNKEPLVTYTSESVNVLAGYGPTSQESNQTYTPVYASYPAVLLYPNQVNDKNMQDIKITLSQGEVLIKVEENCYNFIYNNSKTENIIINNATYNITSDVKIQNYLGLKFFYIRLLKTS